MTKGTRYVRLRLALFAAVSFLGCSNGKDSADAPDTPTGTGGSSSALCPGNGDRQTGSGTIAGSAAGHTFDAVAAARWIGAPDSDATTVVYVFSKPVACASLCSPAWDERIQDQTQILELKLFGTDIGSFTVVTTATPAPGEAAVNTTFTSAGVPDEKSATGGSAELSSIDARTETQGSFMLTFGADTLSGSYDAVYCPGGREP